MASKALDPLEAAKGDVYDAGGEALPAPPAGPPDTPPASARSARSPAKASERTSAAEPPAAAPSAREQSAPAKPLARSAMTVAWDVEVGGEIGVGGGQRAKVHVGDRLSLEFECLHRAALAEAGVVLRPVRG